MISKFFIAIIQLYQWTISPFWETAADSIQAVLRTLLKRLKNTVRGAEPSSP